MSKFTSVAVNCLSTLGHNDQVTNLVYSGECICLWQVKHVLSCQARKTRQGTFYSTSPPVLQLNRHWPCVCVWKLHRTIMTARIHSHAVSRSHVTHVNNVVRCHLRNYFSQQQRSSSFPLLPPTSRIHASRQEHLYTNPTTSTQPNSLSLSHLSKSPASTSASSSSHHTTATS